MNLMTVNQALLIFLSKSLPRCARNDTMGFFSPILPSLWPNKGAKRGLAPFLSIPIFWLFFLKIKFINKYCK